MKVVQAIHHQGDIRYGILRGMQCSCMSIMSLCWILFKSESIFCLNLSINTDILGCKAYYRTFFIESSAINVEFLNNRTREINAGAYFVSITEIVINCQQISTGTLLIINNDI